MNGRPWTTGETKTVREMTKQGYSTSEIAQFLNRPKSTVKQQKRKLELSESNIRPWTKAEEDKLRELFLAGKSKKEIGAALGRTPCACTSKRQELKLYVPPRIWTQEDDNKLASLTAAGVSKKEIAQTLGRTADAIKRRCYVLGIEAPKSERLKNQKKTKSTDEPTEPKGSLCWRCNKACIRGCSWAARFEPVPGWNAKPNGRSYHVDACPEFEPDRPKEWRAKWIMSNT